MLTTHDIAVMQAPGFFPSIVRAECACGWHGPDRDANDPMDRVLVKLDAQEHTE